MEEPAGQNSWWRMARRRQGVRRRIGISKRIFNPFKTQQQRTIYTLFKFLCFFAAYSIFLSLLFFTYLININNGTTSMMRSVIWGDRPAWVRLEYRRAPATPAPPVPDPQPASTFLRQMENNSYQSSYLYKTFHSVCNGSYITKTLEPERQIHINIICV